MATVNKASLRTEFDALKARFESLCAAGKMSAESRALFDALLMLFELLMAVFMEKHTPKSPANSGLPPSQSPNDATARSRPGAKGKGPSYNAERCANTRTREYVTFIVEAHDYAWAKRMKRLLLHACHEVAKRDEKRLKRERVQGRTETLPHHPHPGRARASADSTASKGPTRQGRQVRRP